MARLDLHCLQLLSLNRTVVLKGYTRELQTSYIFISSDDMAPYDSVSSLDDLPRIQRRRSHSGVNSRRSRVNSEHKENSNTKLPLYSDIVVNSDDLPDLVITDRDIPYIKPLADLTFESPAKKPLNSVQKPNSLLKKKKRRPSSRDLHERSKKLFPPLFSVSDSDTDCIIIKSTVSHLSYDNSSHEQLKHRSKSRSRNLTSRQRNESVTSEVETDSETHHDSWSLDSEYSNKLSHSSSDNFSHKQLKHRSRCRLVKGRIISDSETSGWETESPIKKFHRIVSHHPSGNSSHKRLKHSSRSRHAKERVKMSWIESETSGKETDYDSQHSSVRKFRKVCYYSPIKCSVGSESCSVTSGLVTKNIFDTLKTMEINLSRCDGRDKKQWNHQPDEASPVTPTVVIKGQGISATTPPDTCTSAISSTFSYLKNNQFFLDKIRQGLLKVKLSKSEFSPISSAKRSSSPTTGRHFLDIFPDVDTSRDDSDCVVSCDSPHSVVQSFFGDRNDKRDSNRDNGSGEPIRKDTPACAAINNASHTMDDDAPVSFTETTTGPFVTSAIPFVTSEVETDTASFDPVPEVDIALTTLNKGSEIDCNVHDTSDKDNHSTFCFPVDREEVDKDDDKSDTCDQCDLNRASVDDVDTRTSDSAIKSVCDLFRSLSPLPLTLPTVSLPTVRTRRKRTINYARKLGKSRPGLNTSPVPAYTTTSSASNVLSRSDEIDQLDRYMQLLNIEEPGCTKAILPQAHCNMILASADDDTMYLKHALNFIQYYKNSYRIPSDVISRVIHRTFMNSDTSLDEVHVVNKLLIELNYSQPGTIPVDWDMLLWCINVTIGRGTESSPDLCYKASLLVKTLVQILKVDLYHRDLTEDRYIRKSLVSKLFAQNSQASHRKDLISYINLVINAGEVKQPTDRNNPEILPVLQELLALSVTVAASSVDSATTTAGDLLNIYKFLPTLHHKHLLLRTLTSDLVRFKVVQLVLESQYSDTLPVCGFPDSVMSVVECFFKAVPLRNNSFTPPTTPSDDAPPGQAPAFMVGAEYSQADTEEIAMLVFYAVNSYLRCSTNKEHYALRRRVRYQPHDLEIRRHDREDLPRLQQHIDQLEDHLLSMSADLTPATDHYLTMLRLLTDIS